MRDVLIHDSESRVVAVRSLQPTLPGIGPDEDAEEVEETGVEPAHRAAEPTVIEELEASALIEEMGSGTLVDSYELGANPAIEVAPRSTPPIPLLRVVPSVAPAAAAAPAPVASVAPIAQAAQASPLGDFAAPPMSHVPPAPSPSAHVPTPAPVVMPRTVFTPAFPPVVMTAAQAPQVMAPAPGPAPRASLSDPMDVLFDAAYDLCFLQTAVEGATHCMTSAMNAVGARAALVHLLDVHSGEFVTVAGFGQGSDGQILSRLEDDDWLLSAGIFKEKPITMEYGGEVSSRPLPRHAVFGELQNVVVVPVIGWGRALAVIEVVDAQEAKLAAGRGENALAYLAQRFAEFLGEREIVIG